MTKRYSRMEIIGLIADIIPQYESLDLALDILQALETNGILTLVEGDAKKGDLIKSKIYEDSPETLGKTYRYDEFKVFNEVKQRRSKLWEEEEFDKIIQRNSIPAYHCKEGV